MRGEKRQNSNKVRQEMNISWILNSHEPTPIAFFRLTHPTARTRAIERYKKCFDFAVSRSEGDKLDKLKAVNNDEEILQRDWEIWLKEKKAILACRANHDTFLNIQQDFTSTMTNIVGTKKSDDNMENDFDIEEHLQELHEDDATNEGDYIDEENISIELNSDADNDLDMVENNNNYSESNRKISDDKDFDDSMTPDYADTFVERFECQPSLGHIRRWILPSGTDVSEILEEYVKTIPETQKCLNPVYWGILDLTGNHPETKSLFSEKDWSDMVKNFEEEVKLSKTTVSDAVCHFFDEIYEIVKKHRDPVMEIDKFFPENIEERYNIKLSMEEKKHITSLKHVIISYIKNLEKMELPISEQDFDSSFSNLLMKNFLDQNEVKIDVGEICCWASSQRRNKGRSVVLRARIGQKCDFKATLKHSIDKLEALVGLRSGGLPETYRKKVIEDNIDLAVTMRDILYMFFISNEKTPDDMLHKTFVLGTQSWGWNHDIYGMDCKATNICRLGRLHRTKMPSTSRTVACLENFYFAMLSVKNTLKDICEHANDNVALAQARAHRYLKRKIGEESEVGGCFGIIKSSPKKIQTKSNLTHLI
ncbi:9341_t:CDS:10 [Funneliformis geosporum]|uniref:14972_t:CDS:1 n=1 Tax=Funneliformis geosporum TaxID=1117311 RepID=A0A9W4X400_9GLOM|nr:14972_t:CDS:10 [Funneliformis geosporum]CAI2189654.1 9341_t:CDS:10 [Funneliformis geosporum]